jgi:hypothetical protein
MSIDLKKNIDVRYAIGLVVLFVISMAALLIWYFFLSDGKWDRHVAEFNSKVHEYEVSQCYQKFDRNAVETQLEQYRTCETTFDCELVQGTMCGYQHGTLVNARYAEEARRLISPCEPTYSGCQEDGPMVWPVCENHHCQFKIAKPGELPPIQ